MCIFFPHLECIHPLPKIEDSKFHSVPESSSKFIPSIRSGSSQLAQCSIPSIRSEQSSAQVCFLTPSYPIQFTGAVTITAAKLPFGKRGNVKLSKLLGCSSYHILLGQKREEAWSWRRIKSYAQCIWKLLVLLSGRSCLLPLSSLVTSRAGLGQLRSFPVSFLQVEDMGFRGLLQGLDDHKL